ncbi:MAG: amino acid carrier protein [Oscillospiraceae bacterium]|nr:amino acid carrier protein [Oscillospiraceae bacterium]MDY4104252.1 amino acid carrier protein [Oscillospiraceae bacterium]
MTFLQVLELIDGWVWGPVMLVILVGTGVFLTIRTKFLPWRNLGYSIKSTLSKDARTTDRGVGDVSPFACLCTALAATIGTGNIAGVASALAVGGPGALVWMWISAAFGITSKFTECALAVKYRTTNDKGEMLGGPMMSAEVGIPAVYGEKFAGFGKFLGVLFAAFAVVASFGIGNLTQGNSIADAFNNLCGVPMWVVGIIVGLLTLVIVVGGLKSISKVSSVVVPVMAIFYFIGALIVILCHITALPGAIVDMFRMAFSVKAVGGGVAGSVVASMAQAMNKGIARGCFSNEAGMGSAAITASAATTDNHVRQGYINSTGTFWDTFVVCSVTGLAILTSGVMDQVVVDGEVVLKGASLTIAAFRSTLGPVGAWLVAIALALFAFSTILGWEYHGEKALEYLTRSTKVTMAYRILFSVIAFVGCVSAFEIAWDISDILNALMVIPNAIIMIMLVGPLVKDMDDFQEIKRREKEAASR